MADQEKTRLLGQTRLNLGLVLGHIENAVEILDNYELEISDLEEEQIREPLAQARQRVKELHDYTNTDIEVAQLEQQFGGENG